MLSNEKKNLFFWGGGWDAGGLDENPPQSEQFWNFKILIVRIFLMSLSQAQLINIKLKKPIFSSLKEDFATRGGEGMIVAKLGFSKF